VDNRLLHISGQQISDDIQLVRYL